MSKSSMGFLIAALLPLACGDVGSPPASGGTLAVGDVFKIGVLIDSALPGRDDFIAAVHLAEGHLNQGLLDGGASVQFQVLVTSYSGDVQTPAIDLVNNQGALALVVDTSFPAANVNALNYDFTPRLDHKVPVTCFQCSMSQIHDPGTFDIGFADVDHWLFRTFFNFAFENGVQARMVRSRPRAGDLNNDGFVKVVVYCDPEHFPAGLSFSNALDSVAAGPHATEPLIRSGNFDFDMSQIFDSDPDGHPADVVVMLMGPRDGFPALTAFNGFSAPFKPALQLADDLRRGAYLPALIASGIPNLEGSSVLTVNDSSAGPMFRNAFSAATGHLPEQTASYAYDAVVLPALGIAWAAHFGQVEPALIQGLMASTVNDPSGAAIRPRASDFKTAAQRIASDQPINYEGASSNLDIDFNGENYPDLAHWKIQSGKFSDLEIFGCDPDHPTCFHR